MDGISTLYSIIAVLLLMVAILIGNNIGQHNGHVIKSKHVIVPTMTITQTSNRVDTLYIYEK